MEHSASARIPGWLSWTAVLLTLLAAALRMVRVGDASYWGDELVSVVTGQLPTPDVVAWVAENDPHPPLYYLAVHAWMFLAGSSEFSTRLLSALLGCLAVPLIGALGRQLGGPAVALGAMALLAINPLHIAQSRETRMYPLLVALTLASMLLFWRLFTERDARADGQPGGNGSHSQRGLWIAYAAVTAVSLYSHYYAGLVFGGQCLFALTQVRRDFPWVRRWFLAACAVVAGFLPWLVPGLTVVGDYEGYTWSAAEAGSSSLLVALRSCLDTFATGPWKLTGVWQIPAEVYLLAALVLGAIAAFRRDRRLAIFLALYLLTPILVVYVASLRRPIFTPKYLIAASPAYYVLIAFAASWLAAKVRRPAGIAFAAAALVPALAVSITGVANLLGDPALANADWRAAARYVTVREQPTDAVVYGHDGIKWLFGYYHRSPLAEYIPPFGVEGREREVDDALAGLLAKHRRIWFLPWWQSETDVYIEHWLNVRAYKAINRWMGPIRVTMYVTNVGEPPVSAIDQRYGDDLRLTGWALDTTVAEPGDVLRLALQWQALDDLDDNVKVLARLLDDQGRLMAVSDRSPRDEPTTDWRENSRTLDKVGLIIPPGTPPGQYRLDLDVYRAETGERLRPATPNAPGQRVVLGTVSVRPTTRTFAVEAVEAEQVSTYEIPGQLRLAGYSVNAAPRRPGDLIAVTLYWQAKRDGAAVAGAMKLGEAGTKDATLGRAAAKAGEIIRQDLELRVLPGAPPGAYDLRLAPEHGPAATLTRITVVPRAVLPAVATPERTVNARFGAFASLNGLTVRRDAGTVTVQLVWKAEQEVDRSYTVFVHLLDRDGKILAQSDHPPANGERPTTAWLVGDVLGDTHELAIGQVPAGARLAIGLYDPVTFERVRTGNAEAVLVDLAP